MLTNDFFSFLNNDLEEAENMRIVKEQEEEKALFAVWRLIITYNLVFFISVDLTYTIFRVVNQEKKEEHSENVH